MSKYESKKTRQQIDLDRGNEMRQSLREPGAPRDEKLADMVKKRITLPSVAIQRLVNEVEIEVQGGGVGGYNRTYSRHNR